VEIVADGDAGDTEPADQVVVNEILRRGRRACRIEGHHHGAVEPGSGQQPQLVHLVGQTELRRAAAEEVARVRFEGHGIGEAAAYPRHPLRSTDHGAMAEMHPVEIAERDHRALRDGIGRRGVADHKKAGGHRPEGGPYREWAATVGLQSGPSQANGNHSSSALARHIPGNAQLTGRLTADASSLLLGGLPSHCRLDGLLSLQPAVKQVGQSCVREQKLWPLTFRCRFWWWTTTTP
jgi:hypothetical protein